MKPWQANLIGIAIYLSMWGVASVEFILLESLNLLPLPEPLAALFVILLVLQFWGLGRIPAVRRLLSKPVVPPEE